MSETAADMPAPLRDILTESVATVKRREESALDQILSSHQNRVVIFGCGNLGRRAVELLRGIGVNPLAFCDSNPSYWGTRLSELPVLSPAEAATEFGRDALFLIAVWNPHHWYGETAHQLRGAGVRSITSYLPLFWRFPADFLQFYLLNDLPSKVYEAKKDVLAAERVWSDDLSLRVYRANIQWRALGDPEFMPSRPHENSYFPKEIFEPVANECFLDCGAYDGDTVRQFLDRYGANFSAIYSIEGDAVAFEKLRECIGTVPTELANKIHPIHCAVGSERAIVRFDFDGVTGSKENHEGIVDADVQCYPIDDLSIVGPVTMIKMDIEGAEYGALRGASEIIARDKPLLAICVYHTQSDIWRIPLLVHSMLPDYRLFLRAYEGDGFQTVFYAVPPNRLISEKTVAPNLLDLHVPLREILTESVSFVKEHETLALEQILRAHQNRVVIFGCGTLGKRAVSLFREIGVSPLALCDSNPSLWGTTLSDLSVLSPSEAAAQFGTNAVFFVTIWNDFHWFRDTLTKLTSLGCTFISSYAPIFWRFGNRFMDLLFLNERPHLLYQQLEDVLAAEHLWADEESLVSYQANILWRAKGDPSFFPYPAPQNTYFPPNIFKLSPDEVLVDCGAFNGDTLRLLLSITPDFKAFYAVEADTVSIQRLQSYIRTLQPNVAAKVHKVDCAVGSERCTFQFAMNGASTSKIENAGVDVACIPLDELYANIPVTLIKMDIEGAEFDALRGGIKVIQRDSPILAIAVYHTQADVWRIPLLIRSMNPSYQLFLRSYDGDGLQSVVYAVPPNRLLSESEKAAAPNPRKQV